MPTPDSPRVKRFRRDIINAIPKFPNDKATKEVLEKKSLGSLLIDYANWRIRFIAQRARKVVVEQTASNDPRWHSLHDEIQRVLRKVEAGDDLTPYLSPRVEKKGFTPAASGTGLDVDRWTDKDMLLNVMGYHHLHLDAAPTDKMRSDEVIFAHVTRDTFTVFGIFDHTVFEATMPSSTITKERERLFGIFDEHSGRDVSPGSVYVPTLITTSGHSLYFTQYAIRCARTIQVIDPQLDRPDYIRGIYEQTRVEMPAKPKFEWALNNLDFGLWESARRNFFCMIRGPN